MFRSYKYDYKNSKIVTKNNIRVSTPFSTSQLWRPLYGLNGELLDFTESISLETNFDVSFSNDLLSQWFDDFSMGRMQDGEIYMTSQRGAFSLERIIETKKMDDIENLFFPKGLSTIRAFVLPITKKVFLIANEWRGVVLVENGIKQEGVYKGIEELVFSQDGEHYAMIATKNINGYHSWIIIHDWVVVYDDIYKDRAKHNLAISPDWNDILFEISNEEPSILILNGEERKFDYNIVSKFTYSQGWKHLSWVWTNNGEDFFIIQDGEKIEEEFERDIIRERTKAGLKSARIRGRIGGRPNKLTDKQISELKEKYNSKKYSVTDLLKLYSIGKTTFYRLVN